MSILPRTSGGSKGFFLLKAALDDLWSEGVKFSLNIYFTPTEVSPYMKIHGRYSYDELEKVMDETDLLVCPSVWYETFGYTVLEALSFGVPVLVSETVGAKDIIPDDCGWVFKDTDQLKEFVMDLSAKQLQKCNKKICETSFSFDLDVMSTRLKEECYRF